MPHWLLLAYIQMLPVLRAEESLRSAIEYAVGSGSMKDPQDVMRQWESIRDSLPSASWATEDATRAVGLEEYPGKLAGMGIMFVPPEDSVDAEETP